VRYAYPFSTGINAFVSIVFDEESTIPCPPTSVNGESGANSAAQIIVRERELTYMTYRMRIEDLAICAALLDVTPEFLQMQAVLLLNKLKTSDSDQA